MAQYFGQSLSRRHLSAACLCIAIVAVSTTSCAKARAETVADGPPLAMPTPPPRVLGPIDDPLPATAAAPDPSIPAPQSPAASRPPVRRPPVNTADAETRTEPPAVPAAVVPPVEPATVETRELRASPSATDGAAERTVRDLLARAARDLNRVDYGRLSADGKSQYEQSKRFSQQAEQALKDRNFVFATTLADKAAVLAGGLLGTR